MQHPCGAAGQQRRRLWVPQRGAERIEKQLGVQAFIGRHLAVQNIAHHDERLQGLIRRVEWCAPQVVEQIARPYIGGFDECGDVRQPVGLQRLPGFPEQQQLVQRLGEGRELRVVADLRGD